MPWKEHRPVNLSKKFVLAATTPGANVAQLCLTSSRFELFSAPKSNSAFTTLQSRI